MKEKTTTALILAIGTVLSAVVTGGFGLLKNGNGTEIRGNNNRVAGRDFNETTINNPPTPPPPPRFEDLWRQVGDLTSDKCDGEIVVVEGAKEGDVQVRKGDSKFIELSRVQNEVIWHCGGSQERAATGSNFSGVKVTRAKGGRNIDWTFYEHK